MPINSKQKGARGERELSEFLRQRGYEARRGQQYQGGTDSPDVVHNIPGIHLECKFTERLQLYPALDQANNDKKDGEIAVVAHRCNRRDWVAILSLDELLKLLAK
jgi:Holliday junction resolvase